MSAMHPAALLRARYGLDASLLGGGAVDTALRQLAARTGSTVEAYTARLGRSPEALQALAEALSVQETWFGRTEQAFALLTEAPAWRRAFWPGVPRLRVLCLACATGEEAWSVAMALLDAGLGPHEFLVEAVDLSAAALARARSAHYGARAFRGALARQWQQRHCTAEGGSGYTVKAALRACVRFGQVNLLDTRWSEGLSPAHIVFCRNVLIYFDRRARERTLALLAGPLLARDGVLFTGHAEAALMAGRFAGFGPPGAFAFKRRPAPLPRPAAAPGRVQPAPAARPKPPAAPACPPARRAASQADAAGQLDSARSLADAGRYSEALARLERMLEDTRTDADAWLLKALVESALGKADAAHASLRRTLYLEPRNTLALLTLARLEGRAGHTERARLLRERAARAGARAGAGEAP